MIKYVVIQNKEALITGCRKRKVVSLAVCVADLTNAMMMQCKGMNIAEKIEEKRMTQGISPQLRLT